MTPWSRPGPPRWVLDLGGCCSSCMPELHGQTRTHAPPPCLHPTPKPTLQPVRKLTLRQLLNFGRDAWWVPCKCLLRPPACLWEARVLVAAAAAACLPMGGPWQLLLLF